MSTELTNALIIALITNALGLIIFLIGQIILSLIINPYKEFKERLEKVEYFLDHHSRFYTSPLILQNKKGEFDSSKAKEINDYQRKVYSFASDDLRKAAISMLVKAKRVPNFMLGSFGLPTWENVQKAYSDLIFLSNSTFMGNPLTNHEKSKEINKFLGF